MMEKGVNSQALILARESRGYSQKQVADGAGVSQELISKAENDLRNLGEEHVEKIAQFLGYPTLLFYEPGFLRDGTSTCLYHRKRKTLPAKVLSRVNATMHIRNINVNHILNGIEVIGQRQFHTLDIDEFGSPTLVARALRTAWRIPDGPIVNLVALIESAGGVIVTAPFGHRKLFGMSSWTTHSHPLFYLNSEIAMADLRWTIAHELGHLVMHGFPTAGDIEAEADEFAAEFLTPAAAIKAHLKGLTIENAGRLKMHWRVSIKTLIRRAESVGAITRDSSTRLYKQYSARGYNAAEPYPLKDETPTILNRALQVHLEDHNYTHAELLEAIRLSTEDDYREVGGMSPGKGGLSVVRS
jgi:Zn-dependent peptidase ImmA (M78 family)/transcriptional regulator with XRE-family HTH domain